MASKTINYKKIGKNLNVQIGDQKLTKVVEKEEGDKIIADIKKYNTKNSPTLEKTIIKALSPVTQKKKEETAKKIVEAKGQKQLAKKQVKKEKVIKKEKDEFSVELAKLVAEGKDSPEEVQKLINKFKKVEEKTAPKPTTAPVARQYRGEGS